MLPCSKDNTYLMLRDLECNKTVFDTVENCDYVYELLHVKINELLVDVMNEL